MDMEEMMKAAQQAAETMQQKMNEAQVKLDSLEVEGTSGGGLVRIRATAKGRILSVSIDDSLIVPQDKQMLEDLVTAAFNDARTKADQAAGAEMQKVQAGMGLPPGFKLPGMG
jgi:DNA-binding YbaB/EbfC family protein